jgi:hypothetical protein
MKVITIAFAFGITGCALFGAPTEATGTKASPRPASGLDVRLYQQQDSCKIALERYDKPLNITSGELPAGEKRHPGWFDAFRALRRIDQFDFNDWSKLFTDEYKQRFGLTEGRFNKFKADFNLDNQKRPLRSALYAVYVTSGVKEYCFVVGYDFELLHEFPSDISKLKYGVGIIAYERQNGMWRNQIIEATGWARKLPLENIGRLQEIIDSKAAVIELNGQVIPLSEVK